MMNASFTNWPPVSYHYFLGFSILLAILFATSSIEYAILRSSKKSVKEGNALLYTKASSFAFFGMILCAAIAVWIGEFEMARALQYGLLAVPLLVIGAWATNHRGASDAIDLDLIRKEQDGQIQFHILVYLDQVCPTHETIFKDLYGYIVNKSENASQQKYHVDFALKISRTFLKKTPPLKELENALDLFEVSERRVFMVIENMIDKKILLSTPGIAAELIYRRQWK